MIIIGSNVNSETKEVTIRHRYKQFRIDLLTTKRGIVIDIPYGKVINNGTQFMIVDNKEEIFEFEKELENIGEMMKNG